MLVRFMKKWLPKQGTAIACDGEEGQTRPGGRRGATAMEYLVMLSFILMALIMAVQHLGNITGGSMGNTAKAISSSSSSGGPG